MPSPSCGPTPSRPSTGRLTPSWNGAPGHGDVYLSLARTGLLDSLRDMGIRYAFLSNADNLGATCDPDIAAWLLREQVPYLAEVCTRTVNDRKGGHLARRISDGRIVLRDNAMVVPGEEHFFADETRHATFHANNLWVDLDVVARMLDERDGVLGLPIIVNRKTVDPTDKTSTKVIQIECAMGTAIEAIDGSRAMHVPRSRFRPVKTTNELTSCAPTCSGSRPTGGSPRRASGPTRSSTSVPTLPSCPTSSGASPPGCRRCGMHVAAGSRRRHVRGRRHLPGRCRR